MAATIKLTPPQKEAVRKAYLCFLTGRDWFPAVQYSGINAVNQQRLTDAGIITGEGRFSKHRLTELGLEYAREQWPMLWWEVLMGAFIENEREIEKSRLQENALLQFASDIQGIDSFTHNPIGNWYHVRFDSGVEIKYLRGEYVVDYAINRANATMLTGIIADLKNASTLMARLNATIEKEVV